MAILTGYQKVKKYVKESTGFRLLSAWTASDTVELSDGTTLQSLVDGLGDASKKDVDTSIGVATTSVNVPTSKAVADLVSSSMSSSDAMVFKGTIGTNTGDIATDLPTTEVVVGDTYKIATAGTYASVNAKVGDLFIATSTTPTWSYVPSGDETITQLTYAEYQALTDKTGLYEVTDLDDGQTGTVIYNYTGDKYETTEKVVGCWIDGRPIYRKSYSASGLSVTASSLIIDSTVIKSNISTLVDLRGTFSDSSGNLIPPFSTGSVFLYLYVKDTGVAFSVTGTSYIISAYNVTIEYTKASDAENSFTPDMLSETLDTITLPTVATDDEVEEVLG